MSEKNSIKHISDISLTAYLCAVGYSLIMVENEGPRATFVFEDSPEIQRDILKFYNREATVEPLTLCENLKNLKGLLRVK